MKHTKCSSVGLLLLGVINVPGQALTPAATLIAVERPWARTTPVLFYVDPAIANNPEESGVKSITLSYTLYNKGPEALAQYLRAHPVAGGPTGQVKQ